MNNFPMETEMNKRRERFNPVAQVKRDRALSAEAKVKELRLEVGELRRQLFRAQESARLANEEANARAMAQRQSGEALRASNAALDKRYRELFAAFDQRGEELQAASALASQPLRVIAAQRIAARFGRSA